MPYVTHALMSEQYGLDSLLQGIPSDAIDGGDPSVHEAFMDKAARAAQGWLDGCLTAAGYEGVPFDLEDPAFPGDLADFIRADVVVVAVFRMLSTSASMREALKDRYDEIVKYWCGSGLTLVGIDKTERTPLISVFNPLASCVGPVDTCLLGANQRVSMGRRV